MTCIPCFKVCFGTFYTGQNLQNSQVNMTSERSSRSGVDVDVSHKHLMLKNVLNVIFVFTVNITGEDFIDRICLS